MPKTEAQSALLIRVREGVADVSDALSDLILTDPSIAGAVEGAKTALGIVASTTNAIDAKLESTPTPAPTLELKWDKARSVNGVILSGGDQAVKMAARTWGRTATAPMPLGTAGRYKIKLDAFSAANFWVGVISSKHDWAASAPGGSAGTAGYVGGTANSIGYNAETGVIRKARAPLAGVVKRPAKVGSVLEIDLTAKKSVIFHLDGAKLVEADVSAWPDFALAIGSEAGSLTATVSGGRGVITPAPEPDAEPDPDPTPIPIPTGALPMLGMNPGNESPVITEALNWVKRPDGKTATQILGMNLDRTTWAKWIQVDWLWNFMNGAQAPGETYKGWRGHLNITTSLMLEPANGSSMAAAARGEYKPHYKQQAQNLKAKQLPGQKLYIRPSNEFNGTWFAHSTPAKNAPADFKAAWNHFCDSYREVFGDDAIGKTVFFVWCFNIGKNDPEVAWPGERNVHIIEIDFYWSWLDHRSVPYDQAFEFFRTHSNGLQRQVDLCRKYGKRPGIGEYGVGSFDAASRKKPGDDTRAGATLVQKNSKPFFDALAKWLIDNGYEYHIYFGRDIPGDVFAKMASGPGAVGSDIFKAFVSRVDALAGA